MPANAFLILTPTTGTPYTSESTIDTKAFWGPGTAPFDYRSAPAGNTLFEVADYSTGVEQTLSIGSTTGGTGAGKLVSNPLAVRRRVDVMTQQLLVLAAKGLPFKYVDLVVLKSTGAGSPAPYLLYRFGFCAIKTLEWSGGDDAPLESVSFEYGAFAIAYSKQNLDGSLAGWSRGTGWNRVKNTTWDGVTAVS